MPAEHEICNPHLPAAVLMQESADAALRAHTPMRDTYLGRCGTYVLENTTDVKRNRILALTVSADGCPQKVEKLRRLSTGGAELVGVARGDKFRARVSSWADVVEFLKEHAGKHWNWLVASGR